MSSAKLRKSKADKKISGVLGGVSEYLEVDSTVIRLAFIAIAVMTGGFPAVIGYFIASWIMPSEAGL